MTISDRVRVKNVEILSDDYYLLQKTTFEYRRARGYGRAIMSAAEDWLRAAGIAKLQLMVRRENARAGAFYQSIGYAEAQTIVFAKWLDGRDPTP